MIVGKANIAYILAVPWLWHVCDSPLAILECMLEKNFFPPCLCDELLVFPIWPSFLAFPEKKKERRKEKVFLSEKNGLSDSKEGGEGVFRKEVFRSKWLPLHALAW